jgi:predicted flap endonuclease-1-like 5' DNA nuclease
MPAKQPNSRNQITACDWPIEQLPGLSPEEQTKLQNSGLITTKELLQQGKTAETRVALANKLQVNLQYVNKWIALADLARIPGIGLQYCGLLLHSGIGSVVQLAQTPTQRLHKQVMRLQVSTMQRRDLCPTIDVVEQWSQQAKRVLNCER